MKIDSTEREIQIKKNLFLLNKKILQQQKTIKDLKGAIQHRDEIIIDLQKKLAVYELLDGAPT